MRATLSDDTHLQQMARSLLQSESSASQVEFRQSLDSFKRSAEDSLASSLGKTPGEVGSLAELSKYESGKKLANTLADEYHAQVDPLAKEFEAIRNRHGNVELDAGMKPIEFEKAKSKAVAELGKLTREAQEATAAGNVEKAIEASAKLEESHKSFQELMDAGRKQSTTEIASGKIMELAEKEG